MNASDRHAAFTPGPWRAEADTRLCPWTDAVNIMAGEIWIASTTRGFEGDGTEGNSQAIANANLIAAAPALYEALTNMAAHYAKHGPWDEMLGSSEQTVEVNAAMTALAIARGEPV